MQGHIVSNRPLIPLRSAQIYFPCNVNAFGPRKSCLCALRALKTRGSFFWAKGIYIVWKIDLGGSERKQWTIINDVSLQMSSMIVTREIIWNQLKYTMMIHIHFILVLQSKYFISKLQQNTHIKITRVNIILIHTNCNHKINTITNIH